LLKAEKVLCHPLEGAAPRYLPRIAAMFFGISLKTIIPPLLCNEGIHRENNLLFRENLLGENAVNFLIGVKTGVLDDNAS
jgi:hypothetical protein